VTWVFSALVAYRNPGARPRRRPHPAPALALAAALGAVVPTTACTSSPASSGPSTRHTAAPAVTAARARQVWEHYVTVSGPETMKTGNPALALALETGPQRAYDAVSDAAVGKTRSASALRQPFPGLVPPAYTTPTFYLPEQSGYPLFFVVNVARKLTGNHSPAAAAPAFDDGAEISAFGPELILFEQASAGKPWLLAALSTLAVGETLPKLATDSAGYVPTVPLSDAALLAPPADTAPLQAAVVDDGPASAATRAVASGPLTTGLYQGAVDHADELTPPHGDVYQWELQGVNYPEFALRTASGGALVFYAMSLATTVAVPDYINKADPIHSGPPIKVPAAVKALLPSGQSTPLVQLSSDQTLSFVAVDPAQGPAKIKVVAMGGGLTAASAS
jgi:hypothetical protein